MASSIPGAVAYYLNLATTTLNASTDTPNNSTPFVFFGKQLLRYTAPVTLQVQGVTGIRHAWAELGNNYKVEEQYKIQNQLVSFAGGTDYLSRMKEVFENFLLIAVALGADYTMGGNLRLCLPMIDGNVIPGAMQNGNSACTLNFDIHCEARVPSLS